MSAPGQRPVPRPVEPPGAPAGSAADRGRWLVFATSGPAIAAARVVGPPLIEVTGRADAFTDALARHRPRLVIVSAPPARPAQLALLADVRRRRPGLRIVLVDPPAAHDERLAALRAGFDDALPSSIDPAELLGRVRLLLARDAADRAPTGARRRAVAPGVELDLIAHQLRRDGRPLHVRPKEFAVLALLATHPGRAFSRDELLRLVWGADRQGDPRTVDVHIRWLRAKVEPDPAHPAHLVTVRGLGYRLDPAPLTEP